MQYHILTSGLKIKERFIANRIPPVKPKNRYWEKNGITFEDPDGFRIVISVLRSQ
jgi:hypothetical protein